MSCQKSAQEIISYCVYVADAKTTPAYSSGLHISLIQASAVYVTNLNDALPSNNNLIQPDSKN